MSENDTFQYDPAIDAELFKRLNDEAKAESEASLYAFLMNAWPTLESRFELDTNWHMGLICEHLEAVYLQQVEKLIINVPTRYLKSTFCTISFPAWVWQRDAKKKILSWSYSMQLSTALSWKRRQLIESAWYQTFWGDRVQMADDQNVKTEYANKAGGEMKASSTGGSMTGSGCDIMVIDDPQNPAEASSDTEREKCIDFWSGTASSRFDDKKNKSCVLVMQRLHEKDLTGHFLAEYEDVVHLKIPNQAPERIVYSYPMTGRVKVFDEGEILQPRREDERDLAQAKKELGSYNYAAQRQQEPVPRGGGMIKEEWLKKTYWRELPDRFDQITLSIDCAFKDLESSDYVVLQAWGQKGADHYLIRQLRDKMSFMKTRSNVKAFAELFPSYHEFLVEAKANGDAIINSLQGVVRSLIPISPKDSKIARLAACEPEFEAGNVHLPDPDLNPWVKNEYVPELTAFPKSENDDQVDCTTQYLNRARTRNVGEFSDDFGDFANISGNTIAGSI